MKQLSITVTDTTGRELGRPVTSGVPLSEGAAPCGAVFHLRDTDGTEVLVQTSVMATWADGSARWLLLDFVAIPPAGAARALTLSWDAASDADISGMQLKSKTIASDKASLSWAGESLLRISERLHIRLEAIGEGGEVFRAQLENAEIETLGHLRSTICVSGSLVADSGARLFSYRLRASIFKGLSRVLIEPMILIDADKGILTKIKELSLNIETDNGAGNAVIGSDPAGQCIGSKLMQVDDENYIVDAGGLVAGKAPGWAEIDDGQGRVAVALRDFWQQWPKSLSACRDGLAVGLFPAFEPGMFEHMQPWYKHDYLFEKDCYRLREGQSRRWQIWIDTDLSGAELALCARSPLVAAADPVQAMATGVWGGAAAAGTPGMSDYDEWAANLCESYNRGIESNRDYGAMNWGDWWGERNSNWGNHEYDTPSHLLLQFARTADPKYFHAGDTSARHTAEVDVIHFVNTDIKDYFEQEFAGWEDYPIRPGMVHEHCVGHVGGFHSVQTIRDLFISKDVGQTTEPYLCLDPYNLGHIFTIGMMYDYFLTGDPWIRETLEIIRENLVKLINDRVYQFKGHSHCGRTNGWTMLALAGVYELDFDERCLAAMRILADDALSEQDPYCGGWLYELPWGHCFCTTNKHVGEAGFISAVRINGLARYYDLTQDERIPDAIRRGITHLNNDTWREEHSDWRYTSCPASSRINQAGVIMAALAASVRITGDKRHLEILRKAWEAKFMRMRQTPISGSEVGKTFSSSIYGCPETVGILSDYDMASCRDV